jgi:hypothetical protein
MVSFDDDRPTALSGPIDDLIHLMIDLKISQIRKQLAADLKSDPYRYGAVTSFIFSASEQE